MCGRAGVSIGLTNCLSDQPLARANARSHSTAVMQATLGFLQCTVKYINAVQVPLMQCEDTLPQPRTAPQVSRVTPREE